MTNKPPPSSADLPTIDAGSERPIAALVGVSLLIYHSSGTRVVTFSEPREVVVGRATSADVSIDDRSLSREHARFVYRNAQLWVEDLQSRNGTRVNGARCHDATLQTEDEVIMGGVIASVHVRRSGPADEPGGPLDAPDTARSSAMNELYRTVDLVADADVPVLILGETGAGKEVVARAIHERSPRREAPMRAVNCGAMPRELTESLLFGHERGAFTGADQRSKGLFEEAHGGTLLLDEIGELPAAAQAALLRVLETGRIMRVGSAREVDVDVRIVAATHRDLEQMCESGAFRSDSYYRLNTMTLEVPPLRERREEIVPLAEHFARHARTPASLTDAARHCLARYAWPGNIRELRNVIDRAVILSRGAPIDEALLPPRLRRAVEESMSDEVSHPDVARSEGREEPQARERSVDARASSRAAPTVEVEMLAREPTDDAALRESAAAVPALGAEAAAVPALGAEAAADAQPALEDARKTLDVVAGDLRGSVERYEVVLLQEALRRAKGNQSEAARALKIPQRTMSNKVARYGIGAPSTAAAGDGEGQGERQAALADAQVVQLRARARHEFAAAESLDLRGALRDYERAAIGSALALEGTRAEAARSLGLPLRTLAHKIRALALDER